jgi:uncharacterized repeat protein (TIGR03803 family)
MALSGLKVTAGAIAAMVALSAAAAAQNYSIVHSFKGKNNGVSPQSRLLLDKSGALYGTTIAGGQFNRGVAFKFSQSGGVWKETVLHDFGNGNGNSEDGRYPAGGLIEDSAGALFGVTSEGGANLWKGAPHQRHAGTAFELSKSGGVWTEQILYNFGANSGDGIFPGSGLLLDETTGVLYGTTDVGGAYGCGTVFELTPSAGGWSESILYSFENDNDACGGVGLGSGYTALHRDATGILYGTSYGSRALQVDGTVYALAESSGVWSKTVLYDFDGGSSGGTPGDIDLDASGAMYGVTGYGGLYGCGTVFELTQSGGVWTETTLYNFQGGTSDGCGGGTVHLDRKTGALYVTTGGGGAGDGTVSELTRSGGLWTEKVLHSFTGEPDGDSPFFARVVQSKNRGTLYGTTSLGGTDNRGTVFQITQ